MQYAASFGYTLWLRAQDRVAEQRCRGQWRGGDATGPVRRAGGGRDHRAAHDPGAGPRHRLPRPPVPHQQRCWRGAPAPGQEATDCRSRRDVSINSLHLTDVDIGYFNSSMRLHAAAAPAARPRRAARRAGRRHHRRAGQRPQRRSPPTRRPCPLPRADARRDRPGAAAEPRAATGARTKDCRWRSRSTRSPLVRSRCWAARSARWRRARAAWSRAASADVVVFDAEATGAVTPERLVQPGQAHAVRVRHHRLRAAGPRALHAGGRHGRLRSAGHRSRADRLMRTLVGVWRALRMLAHVVHGVYIAAGALARFRHADQASPCRLVVRRRCYEVLGVRLEAPGPQAPSAAADHGEPHLLAGHCRDARGDAGGAFRLEGRHRDLAAGGRAGDGRRHALHRARDASATRCVWCTNMAEALAAGDRSACFPRARRAPAIRCCRCTAICCRRPFLPARRCSPLRCADAATGETI